MKEIYDYFVVDVDAGSPAQPSMHKVETKLATAGKDGWELVAVVFVDDGSTKYLRHYFKKAALLR